MQKNSIEIRDLRNREWVWTSKKLLFHPKIDGNAYKVYGGLSAYADNHTQEAFPSIETLAVKLHMSRNTVIKGTTTLDGAGFIKIDKRTGEHNIYTLLSGSDEKKEALENSTLLKSKALEKPKEDDKQNTDIPPAGNANTVKLTLFQVLWHDYPNHANKKIGEQKFEKLSREMKIKVIEDVRARKKYHDTWIKGFIPYLATYINQERWNDPIIRPETKPDRTKNFIHPEVRKRLFKNENQRRYEDSTEEKNNGNVVNVGELMRKNI